MTTTASPPSVPGSSEDAHTSERRGTPFQRYPRSFGIGAIFAAAWTPCVGPILGVVLTLAATSGRATHGGLLLICYALGLGVWFLALGAGFGLLAPHMRALQPYTGKLMAVVGVVFIAIGALMVLGEFRRLNNEFAGLGFLFNSTSGAEDRLRGDVPGLFGPAVAFFAGTISFLSPCVLPLVPAYLVNIAGEAVLAGADATAADRRRVFGHAVAFVAGFTLVFAVLGASVGFAGSLLIAQLPTLTRIGGVLLIVLGLQASGLIRIPFLERTYGFHG